MLSSKSAINTLAPLFNALMTILRSGGPVISTRRSLISSGMSHTCHAPKCCAFFAVPTQSSGHLYESLPSLSRSPALAGQTRCAFALPCARPTTRCDARRSDFASGRGRRARPARAHVRYPNWPHRVSTAVDTRRCVTAHVNNTTKALVCKQARCCFPLQVVSL